MTIFDDFKQAMKEVFPITNTWNEAEWMELHEIVDDYAEERRYQMEQDAD